MGGKLEKINVEKSLRHINEQLSQKIAANGNNTTLNLSSSKYTDNDMEIVAEAIEKNTVGYNYLCFTISTISI